MSQYPKKNPLSMQLDLSKFSLATDDEKKMADRMRESTSFFKDGMRRLRKNVVSMICLVIIVALHFVGQCGERIRQLPGTDDILYQGKDPAVQNRCVYRMELPAGNPGRL